MTTFLPPFNVPEGVVLLVTDELAAPADFVLHKTLADYLKKSPRSDVSAEGGVKVVILSVSESLQRWKALASKSVSIHSVLCK